MGISGKRHPVDSVCQPAVPAVPGLAPRSAALTVLQALARENATLDAQLEANEHRCATPPDRRDLALTYHIVFGVLRWQGRIDWVLSRFSRRPLVQLDTAIRNILRIGAFQILFLDRIPQAAAVGTAVALAKNSPAPWAAGYVNAALRHLCRGATTVTFPDLQQEPAAAIAALGSLPHWLAKRWADRFGAAPALQLAERINRIPPLTLRTNRLRTTREALLTALQPEAKDIYTTRHAPDGVCLHGLRSAIGEMTAFRSGLFQVQDEAAQLVTLLLSPSAGERILDACAGQGGKTGHIAQMMKDRGELLALDRSAAKLTRLEAEMDRLGLRCVTPRVHDLDHPLSDERLAPFDRVLLDAPCSGLGVLRRNPDIKWRRRAADLPLLASEQRRMLERTAPLLRPGGVLVYSVCSFEPEETEMVIDQFLALHPEFTTDAVPEALRDNSPELFTDRGFLCTLPQRHEMDGFFAVRLVRRADS